MKKYYFTSESVTEGHPDKLCDYISDSILDKYIQKDKNARVAIETLATKNKIVVAGQITCKTDVYVDVEEVVRETIKEVGYGSEELDINPDTCIVDINITKQSEEIASGVEKGGAGDQGIMFGYATNETKSYMPFAIDIAHKLALKLSEVRKKKIIPYLRPDGKTQVTVEYINYIPKRIDAILISSQHEKGIDLTNMKNDIIEKVIKEVVSEEYLDEHTKIYVNPTGSFTIGGPLSDTGVTGRKIIVDTYGSISSHGGGAFSGKDATKLDRSAAYMLRHIAKNVIANNYADKCQIQISYGIGLKSPISLYIDTFGTGKIPEEELLCKIKEKFDLTPNGIITYLDLKKPLYRQTTNYGHFGKDNLPWENIIKM